MKLVSPTVFSGIRGTVTLVSLCFVAVMGITLAGYIAVCSRAMNLSNRTFQGNLSKQLAEVGIDEALRAFNKNDWSGWASNPTNITGGTTAWTLDTTNKRATRTIIFNSPKFGQGVTGTIKIRIDNYNTNQLDSSWNSSTNYRLNNLVGYSGTWYRCLVPNSNKTPSATTIYWMQEQVPITTAWLDTAAYTAGNMATYNNIWYRCTSAHTSSVSNRPPNASYWLSIPNYTADADLQYANESLLNYYGVWYRYLTATGWDSAPPVSWRWTAAQAYVPNDTVSVSNVWYRCILAHTNQGPPNATYWSSAQSLSTSAAASWTWSASEAYNLNDVVYRSSSWYRCILANTNQGPPNATYWSTSPLLSMAWDSGKQYNLNDTVRYNGVWYRYINGTPTSGNLPTSTTYWIGANTGTTSYQWNAATAYSVGAYRCYGGVWYYCSTANTGQSPNNTSYWTAAWANSSGVTTGAPVVYAEGTIAITGSPSIKTQLRATIAPASLFPNAVGAITTISANSGGTVDSYDSNTGTYASQVGTSTNYSAVVAAGDTSGTAVTLSSTAVKGYVAAPSSSTSPFAPLFSSGGTVKSGTSPASPNIDLTRVSRSPHIPLFDTLPGGAGGLAANWATVPKGTALTLSTTINIGTPGATTPSRYYYNGNLTIGTPSTATNLKINGPVILYINGDLFITQSGSSTGRIDIATTGSAEIHVAGAFKADAGGEGILSANTNPKSLIIISDTTSTATHFYSEGVNDLYGVIYIPYGTSNTGYFNDNTNTEVFGAISASKITYSGANLNVHYDTSLRYATFGGVDQPYTVAEWRELPVTEQATLP